MCLPGVRKPWLDFLPGYSGTLLSDASKKRHSDKLNLMDGVDPYEVAKHEWKDDVDLWPAVTPSRYSEKDMLNYKSVDSYQNFIKGWVKQVHVRAVGNKIILIGRVREF